MTYGYDAYGFSRQAGIVRINLENYKTKTGVKTALKKKLERDKLVLTSWSLYSFSGDDAHKYDHENYKILDQFNHKAFFEYWR